MKPYECFCRDKDSCVCKMNREDACKIHPCCERCSYGILSHCGILWLRTDQSQTFMALCHVVEAEKLWSSFPTHKTSTLNVEFLPSFREREEGSFSHNMWESTSFSFAQRLRRHELKDAKWWKPLTRASWLWPSFLRKMPLFGCFSWNLRFINRDSSKSQHLLQIHYVLRDWEDSQGILVIWPIVYIILNLGMVHATQRGIGLVEADYNAVNKLWETQENARPTDGKSQSNLKHL